jgi:hypothetical protein
MIISGSGSERLSGDDVPELPSRSGLPYDHNRSDSACLSLAEANRDREPDAGIAPGQSRADGNALLTTGYNWLFLVFGEPLKTADLSDTLLQKEIAEEASNADHPIFCLTRRIGNDFGQRHHRGTAGVRDLASL